jgi:hypothetical protein
VRQRADSDWREAGLGDDFGGDPGGIVVVGRVPDTPSTGFPATPQPQRFRELV